MASDAVGSERISRVVGYKITKGDFRTVSPNLPQMIAVLGEANTDNQADLETTGQQITSAQQAGVLYGYGSPIYQILRILLPITSDGVGGIPVWVYPQVAAVGAASKILRITATGTANGNGTHTLKIAGRDGVDGLFYDLNIVEGDTPAIVHGKIADAVNAVLGSPVKGLNFNYDARLESKWRGLTANDLSVTIDTGDDDLGITYAFNSVQNGSGTPSVQAALDQFENKWITIVVNGYGAVSSVMNTLENFNGIPNPINPTGRYQGIVMKPFIAVTGSTADDPSSLTDSRLADVTIAIAPAPGSAGLPFEAAANMALLFALVSQNTPHLDVAGREYPDMPTPITIGTMAVYNNRDAIVKKGCSTVDLSGNGKYVVQDFTTTYHPLGEVPPQFRYCRNLMLDWNVRYGYFLLEQINVVDKAIANNSDIVGVAGVIKPKQWIGIINSYADDLEFRALIVDSEFMKASITVEISSSNPDRFETFYRYKRSGVARISSTTAEAGFNFGTLS